MTTFQSHRTEQSCLIAIVGLLAAIAIPNILEARNARRPPGLERLCEAAQASSGTAVLDSESLAVFHGAPRFENGRFVLDLAPGVKPYEPGRRELAAPWAARAVLERGDGFVAVERSSSVAGRVVLGLVALLIAGVAFLMGRSMAGDRRGLKRVVVVGAFLVLNPCLLLPLHALASTERVEIRGGDAVCIRSWSGLVPTSEPLGRVRAVATTTMNGVCFVLDTQIGFRTEALCQLAAHDPRLEATLLGIL